MLPVDVTLVWCRLGAVALRASARAERLAALVAAAFFTDASRAGEIGRPVLAKPKLPLPALLRGVLASATSKAEVRAACLRCGFIVVPLVEVRRSTTRRARTRA